MRGLRKIAAAGLVASAMTGGVLLGTAPAHAASYGGQCGSGYNVIDKQNLTGATVFLTYNAGNKRNCVVTVRNSSGTALPMQAYIRKQGDSIWQIDSGKYTTYAGPVRISAPSTCVQWGGYFNGSSYTSPFEHCG